MHQQIGKHRFLQRRVERVDEYRWQLVDETNCVAKRRRSTRRQIQTPRRRIQRLEGPVDRPDVGARQSVEKRRFARIRVSNQRNGLHFATLPSTTL